MKIGRNDACWCGSGKKYKKCCIDKEIDLQVEQSETIRQQDLYTYERVDRWGTKEIIEHLEAMHIPFDKVAFLEDIKQCYSAEELSEKWFVRHDVKAKGREEDYPFIAAWILWERLAPEGPLAFERMDEFIEAGYAYAADRDPVRASDAWLAFWDALKQRFNPAFTTLDYLEKQSVSEYYFSNVVQDLEMTLHNAGFRDEAYFSRRIRFCREFCTYFPGESELIIHNMKRAIAESYGFMKDYENAAEEFDKLAAAYPDNPWAYIGWGDVYLDEDPSKARELYEKALEIATDKEDVLSVEERLGSFKNE